MEKYIKSQVWTNMPKPWGWRNTSLLSDVATHAINWLSDLIQNTFLLRRIQMNTRLAQKIEPSIDLPAFCQEIRERALAGEFDNQAYVSPDIIERLKQLGVYRAFVPKRFGGDELSPRELEM